MLNKLLITTAAGALLVGAAVAEGNPPAQQPAAAPPAASQSAPSQMTAPAPADKTVTDKMTTPAPAGSAKVINSQKPDQFLASKFRGTDVLGTDNAKIGDVSDILFDKSGKIEAYVVSVGGFLGLGSKHVAIEPAAFQVVSGDKSKHESDKLKLSMTKDQLKQAANFEAYQPPRATTGMAPGAPRPSQTNR